MQTIPDWLQAAFVDWLTRGIYVDGGGNYRSRLSRRVVAYNRPLKRVFAHNDDFHHAAELWLSLWEAVPTARLDRR